MRRNLLLLTAVALMLALSMSIVYATTSPVMYYWVTPQVGDYLYDFTLTNDVPNLDLSTLIIPAPDTSFLLNNLQAPTGWIAQLVQPAGGLEEYLSFTGAGQPPLSSPGSLSGFRFTSTSYYGGDFTFSWTGTKWVDGKAQPACGCGTAALIPEPGTMALMLTGVPGLVFAWRARRRRA